MTLRSGVLIPVSGTHAGPTNGKHDRNFNENADNGGQCGWRGGAEKCDRNGYRQFKEVAGSDERARSRDIVPDLEPLHERVGESRVEIHLDQDWDG